MESNDDESLQKSHLSSKFNLSPNSIGYEGDGGSNAKKLNNINLNLTSIKKIKSPTEIEIELRSFTKANNSTILSQSVLPEITEDGNLLNDLKRGRQTDDHLIKFEKEASYFLACYDPESKEIYFSDFITEGIITKEGCKLTTEIEEKLNKLIINFKERWELISNLSKLDQEEYMSRKSKKYFRRPMSSKFLFPERLELNNFNSCYPLPAAFQQYGMINISITIHDTVCKMPEGDKIIQRKVGFYYVVDTIIKDTLRFLISKCKNYIESNQKSDVFEEILKLLEEDFKDRKNKYVLKLKSFEEFMYGDYPICTYEAVRTFVREYETINLILMKFPINDVVVQPEITHFPPIVYLPPEKEFNYSYLLQLYIDFFAYEKKSEIISSKSPIIFRFKPDVSQQVIYFKKLKDRKEKLLKYVQSGECDSPLYINIKGIHNLFAMKKHIDSKFYNEMEMDLPYFNSIPSMDSIRNKKNIIQKMMNKFCKICTPKQKKGKETDKEEAHEENEHKKQIKSMLEKYNLSLKVQKGLNYLKVPFKEESYEEKMIFFIGMKYSKTLLEKIKELSKEKRKLSQASDNSQQDQDSNIENFSLLNYKLQFLPCFLKLEIILMYGSYEIQKRKTRFFVINNNININEKIYFNQLLISHLPRETRVCINLLAYDKYQNNCFELGSCQTPLYDDNGIMEKGVIPLYIWPLFKIDPRVSCAYNYQGKYYKDNSDSNEEFNRDNYCILFIEFPKFVLPVAYILKTPQSYREFLKLKYPNEDKISNTYEMKVLYSNSMEQLEEIINNLKNRDQYFLKLDKKKKEIKEKDPSKSPSHSKSRRSKDYNDDEKFGLLDKNIWNVLEEALPQVRDTIHKDPLAPLTQDEREYVIYCRDYICTIPSALEVFLRCIDWLNPLQVNIARIYLKKWAKIDPEDAVCLLDPRYPDTCVREYAISILREMTDDLMSMYMLQLCQCLIYEMYLVSPLSDFLIEKSIVNPKLIGVSFFWNAVVSQKNKLFTERLSVFIAQILMVTGVDFLETIQKSYDINEILRTIGIQAKEKYRTLPDADKKPEVRRFIKEGLKNAQDKGLKNFTFPIHPSYKSVEFCFEQCNIFSSKMVPIKIACKSNDGSIFNVIFKSGDDLRQDVLTLQILKIMDKMWLDNDLDLKIVAYRVQPTGLKEGLIEFVEASVIDGLQQKEGVGGALDRELLIKHLRFTGQPPNMTAKYETTKQHDNFVKSLAGFCVATCVLGIGDRHPGNVMVKDNGIFFHIDYGHFLGNFKYKFGIKRERAPFLLTPDMAHVYTKTGREEQFKSICVKAYNILRKNANRLMNLFIIMSSAGLPELSGMNDVNYLKEMLQLDKKNDEDAGNHFIGLINQSKNEKFRLLDNLIHNIKHG